MMTRYIGTNLEVAELAEEHATIGWTDNSLNEAGFDIFRRNFGASSWGSAIGRVTADAVTFADTSVEPSGDYEYRVVAHNKAGTSPSAALRVTLEPFSPARSTVSTVANEVL